jgi:hypothetical protein
MSVETRDRMASLRRLLAAAASVYRDRSRIAREVARGTGLSAEGVEAGFGCLERDATDAELRSLIESAGEAEHVHVILAANVFVAPLRALALALAAAPSVTVRPSSRDPALTRALVAAWGDGTIVVTPERDVGTVVRGEIHVYGRDSTVAAVRAAARPGVVLRAHGAGMGAAIVSRRADIDAAASAIAEDVMLFDQRGCLSPRVVVAEGNPARGEALAAALHTSLERWGERVPRGVLDDGERAEAASWVQTLAFSGKAWIGRDHAVGFAGIDAPLGVPPVGRHLLVTSRQSIEEGWACLAPLSRFLVCVGTDVPGHLATTVPGIRVALLGRMQRPPLDGPVDRRSF